MNLQHIRRFTRTIFLTRIRLYSVGVKKKRQICLTKAVAGTGGALSLRSDMNQKHLPMTVYTICYKVYVHSQKNEYGMRTGADGKRGGIESLWIVSLL